MTVTDMLAKVKGNLKIQDDARDLDILDAIQDVLTYCNLSEPPETLEPFVRRKVQAIINYEAENGTAAVFDVKSIREGDVTMTYNVDADSSRETIYGLSERDKRALQSYRRTRK